MRCRSSNETWTAVGSFRHHELRRYSAPWRIVVGHHPVFTAVGEKHHTPELIAQLFPLLKRHGVQVYMGGHVHNLQAVDVEGIRFVTSGAGSKLGKVRSMERPSFAIERHGFVVAGLSRDTLILQYTDVDGRILRSSVLARV